jgi:hypothetical protein
MSIMKAINLQRQKLEPVWRGAKAEGSEADGAVAA